MGGTTAQSDKDNSNEGVTYRMRSVRIDKDHPLFAYADTMTQKSNNLRNAVRFRQRQVMTGLQKEPDKRTENEKTVLDEIIAALPNMSKNFAMPTKEHFFLSYCFLDALLKVTKNPDYYAQGLPRQSAQWVIHKCVDDMKSYFESWREYKANPNAFTGKPNLPGYGRKGSHHTVIITNQDAKIIDSTDHMIVKLPLTKTRIDIGPAIDDASLKEVRIVPDNGAYLITFCFEKIYQPQVLSQTPDRIAAIDFGVDNLMAITNNCRVPCLIYNGKIAKSANRIYNKKISEIVSVQTAGSDQKFIPTEEYYEVTRRRNDRMDDIMHKTAKHFITWCVENRIDTIVFGATKLWKQEVNIGNVNNQNFVQLPITKLRNIITYLAEYEGIRCIEQEESYTSKASFPDMDPIPVYEKNNPCQVMFSGHRKPTRYKGMYKAAGFRGLYETKDGTIINSDLNGSANILRKAFPDAFISHANPDFANVKIIIHPDYEKAQEIRKRKLSAKKDISKSKQKRIRRKALAA